MNEFLEVTGYQVSPTIRQMQVSIERIAEIALRPNAMTSTESIKKIDQGGGG